MANGINACTFIGNAGRDAEVRNTGSGKQVANFSLAVNERKDGDTLWINVECWDKLATIVGQYVKKGKQVYVAGRLKIRKYTTKDTGEEKTAVDLVANTVQFLGGKSDSTSTAPVSYSTEPLVEDDSKVPF